MPEPKKKEEKAIERFVDTDLDWIDAPKPKEKASGEPAAEALRRRVMADDLRRWRKIARKRLTGTQPRRAFASSAIPRPLNLAISEWLDYATTREDVEWAFRWLVKARRPLVAARRRIRLERKLRGQSNAHFASVKDSVARLVVSVYDWQDAQKLRKIDGPTDDEIDAAMKWDVFAETVRPTLAETYLEGETLAADVSGAEVGFGLTDEQATAYAEERAAELVGKRVLPSGRVIENPNPKWSIPQSVREKLRATIAKALDEGWSQDKLQRTIESPTFWTWRSDMIARTEVAIALNKGTVQVYRDAEVETVTIVDGPGCLMDGHDDAEAGVHGTVVTVEEFEENPVGHPNCRRDAIPNLPEE